MQALQILCTTKSPNVAALTDLIAASQTPILSRLRALEHLVDILPQNVLFSGKKLSSMEESRTISEGDIRQSDASEAADGRPPDTIDLNAALQKLSLSERGEESADLVDNVWAALLAAVQAEKREVRLAAVKSLQQILRLEGAKLKSEVADSLIAVAQERLSDVDARVQSAWRILLPELLSDFEVGHKCDSKFDIV